MRPFCEPTKTDADGLETRACQVSDGWTVDSNAYFKLLRLPGQPPLVPLQVMHIICYHTLLEPLALLAVAPPTTVCLLKSCAHASGIVVAASVLPADGIQIQQ